MAPRAHWRAQGAGTTSHEATFGFSTRRFRRPGSHSRAWLGCQTRAMIVVRATKKFLDRAGGGQFVSLGVDRCVGRLVRQAALLAPASRAVRQPTIPASGPGSLRAGRIRCATASRRLAEIATRLGVGASALGSGLVAMENHVLARTKSRSVLGVINDFAHQADHYRWGRDRLDLVDLSCWLAETPSGPLSTGTSRPDREPPSPFHPTGVRTGRFRAPSSKTNKTAPLEEGASRSGRSPADECERQEVRSWKVQRGAHDEQ